MTSEWLSPPAVAAWAGVLVNAVLVYLAVSTLSSWKREKDFTIARNLFLSLFELDREAHALKDRLMNVTLQRIGALENGTAPRAVDLSERFQRLRARAWAFQSALVEASGRWKSDFGLPTIGLFSTGGIEYSLEKIAEVLSTVVQEEEKLRASTPEERKKRTHELAQECMQKVGKCREVLTQEWERFHTALDPLFEKHFSVQAAEHDASGKEGQS